MNFPTNIAPILSPKNVNWSMYVCVYVCLYAWDWECSLHYNIVQLRRLTYKSRLLINIIAPVVEFEWVYLSSCSTYVNFPITWIMNAVILSFNLYWFNWPFQIHTINIGQFSFSRSINSKMNMPILAIWIFRQTFLTSNTGLFNKQCNESSIKSTSTFINRIFPSFQTGIIFDFISIRLAINNLWRIAYTNTKIFNAFIVATLFWNEFTETVSISVWILCMSWAGNSKLWFENVNILNKYFQSKEIKQFVSK